jgi:PPOX class probable F420-dependent enzyme
VSRRDLIRMTPEEVDAFLAEPHSMNIATYNHDGTIHLVAMWYATVGGPLSDGGAIGFETFAKSQKVLNLRRDARITALVEDGATYDTLRGVELVGEAEVLEDDELLMEIARSVIRRHQPEVGEGDIDAVAEMMVRKRVAVRFTPQRIVSWDHRKLAGGY